jgi:hypothetical protein
MSSSQSNGVEAFARRSGYFDLFDKNGKTRKSGAAKA